MDTKRRLLLYCLLLNLVPITTSSDIDPSLFPVKIGDSLEFKTDELITLYGIELPNQNESSPIIIHVSSTENLTIISYGSLLSERIVIANLILNQDFKYNFFDSQASVKFEITYPSGNNSNLMSFPYFPGSPLVTVDWEYWSQFERLLPYLSEENQKFSYSFNERSTNYGMQFRLTQKMNNTIVSQDYVETFIQKELVYDKQSGIRLSEVMTKIQINHTGDQNTTIFNSESVNNLTRYIKRKQNINNPILSFSEGLIYISTLSVLIWSTKNWRGRKFDKNRV